VLLCLKTEIEPVSEIWCVLKKIRCTEKRDLSVNFVPALFSDAVRGLALHDAVVHGPVQCFIHECKMTSHIEDQIRRKTCIGVNRL
jgi:hypothetical protein